MSNIRQIADHIVRTEYAGCFKKSFTTLRAYINLFRGHVPCFELSQCSTLYQVLYGIVMVRCDFHW
jgi:hypothetical protein